MNKEKIGEWWAWRNKKAFVKIRAKNPIERGSFFKDRAAISKYICVGCHTFNATVEKAGLIRRVNDTELAALAILFPSEFI
jgi:hypothetical protein